MAGLADLTPEDGRYTPPYGAHPLLYEAVEDVLGPRFRQGPNGEPAKKRRNDYLLGAALFIDAPAVEQDKTRVYFAASMIAEAPNRGVLSQTAPLNNYTGVFDSEAVAASDDIGGMVDVVVEAFHRIEEEIEDRLQNSDADKADLVIETLDGVREGRSYFARWGDAREEVRNEAREQGRGKYGF